MNDTSHPWTHLFAFFAGLSSALGITTQDLIYLLFAAAGLGLSIGSFIFTRRDQRRRLAEEERRTQLLEMLVHDALQKPAEERKASLTYLSDFASKLKGSAT